MTDDPVNNVISNVTNVSDCNGNVCNDLKKRKTRNVWAVPFHRESEKNKLLCEEALKQNPFDVKFGKVKVAWENVAEALNKSTAFTKSHCDHQGCQNQVKKLVDYWERRRNVAVKLPHKLTDWEKLLEKVIAMKQQNEYRKNQKRSIMSFDEEMLLYKTLGDPTCDAGGNTSANKRNRLEVMLEASEGGNPTGALLDKIEELNGRIQKMEEVMHQQVNKTNEIKELLLTVPRG
jgi:hypothetical protein